MSRKPTSSRKPPSTSKLERPRPLAYARRQKTGSDTDDDKAGPADTQGGLPIGEQLAALAKPDEAKSAAMKSDKEEAKPAAPNPDGSKTEGAKPDGSKTEGAKAEASKPDDGSKTEGTKADGSKTDDAKADGSKADGPKAEGSNPGGAKVDGSKIVDSEARSKRTTEPPLEQPDVDPWRSRADTQLMPPLAKVGAPPEVPTAAPAMPSTTGGVEHPTFMPGPRDVPAGHPNDPAAPPGRVPRGDSRSLRRENEFALVYRAGTFVISRFGTVGTRGQWRVVEYPTSNAASHAYAKESSRFVSEGFSDYRDY